MRHVHVGSIVACPDRRNEMIASDPPLRGNGGDSHVGCELGAPPERRNGPPPGPRNVPTFTCATEQQRGRRLLQT